MYLFQWCLNVTDVTLKCHWRNASEKTNINCIKFTSHGSQVCRNALKIIQCCWILQCVHWEWRSPSVYHYWLQIHKCLCISISWHSKIAAHGLTESVARLLSGSVEGNFFKSTRRLKQHTLWSFTLTETTCFGLNEANFHVPIIDCRLLISNVCLH